MNVIRIEDQVYPAHIIRMLDLFGINIRYFNIDVPNAGFVGTTTISGHKDKDANMYAIKFHIKNGDDYGSPDHKNRELNTSTPEYAAQLKILDQMTSLIAERMERFRPGRYQLVPTEYTPQTKPYRKIHGLGFKTNIQNSFSSIYDFNDLFKEIIKEKEQECFEEMFKEMQAKQQTPSGASQFINPNRGQARGQG